MLRSGLLLSLTFCAVTAMAQDDIHYARLDREDVLRCLTKAVKGNNARRIELKNLFIRAGCKGDRLTEQPVEGSDTPNLICTLPGTSDSAILVGAHYDSAPDSLGVADNWSGAALLPNLYQSLNQRLRQHTFIFIGFAAGLHKHAGAAHYAKSLDKAQAKRIRAAVILDSLGASFTRAWSADRVLLGFLKGVSSAVKIPVEAEDYKDITKGAHPFVKRGIPTITVHSASKFNGKWLGAEEDTLDLIKENEYYESYMLLAALLAYLDVK